MRTNTGNLITVYRVKSDPPSKGPHLISIQFKETKTTDNLFRYWELDFDGPSDPSSWPSLLTEYSVSQWNIALYPDEAWSKFIEQTENNLRKTLGEVANMEKLIRLAKRRGDRKASE